MDHLETAELLHNLAAVVEGRGSHVGASILYRRALWIHESRGRGSLDVALTCNNLGRLLAESSELEQACGLLERAVQIMERSGATQYLASARRNLEYARAVRGGPRALGA